MKILASIFLSSHLLLSPAATHSGLIENSGKFSSQKELKEFKTLQRKHGLSGKVNVVFEKDGKWFYFNEKKEKCWFR